MTPRTERAALRLILCDLYSALVEAWNREFRGYPEVEAVRGDFLEIAADAYVSPANSYGIMDGGIDLALRALLTAVDQFNAANPGAIETLACPGLCTGVGGMPVDVAARQMGQAYAEFYALE